MKPDRGSILIALLPIMTALIYIYADLFFAASTLHELLSSAIAGMRADSKNKNAVLREGLNLRTGENCITAGGWRMCPVHARNFYDFEPFFSNGSNCPAMIDSPAALGEADDVVSAVTCTGPSYESAIVSLRSNLVVGAEVIPARTSTLAVRGVIFADSITVSGDLFMVSGGSVRIRSLSIPEGITVSILSARKVDVGNILGAGRLVSGSTRDPNFDPRSFSGMERVEHATWSLSRPVDTAE